MRAIFDAVQCRAEISAVSPTELEEALERILSHKPDLLITLAGDGTIRRVAEACGPDGPMILPLPGGTMNVLPRMLYGTRDWKTALQDTLTDGMHISVSGGTVSGHSFYVAAILGAPALWARTREAVREGNFRGAFKRARYALARAFSSRLYYTIDRSGKRKTEALALICPAISKVMTDETCLEAIALDPPDAMAAFALGVRSVIGDWRQDPHTQSRACRAARAWAHQKIPCLVDGETVHIGHDALIAFQPTAFHAYVPRTQETPA